MRLDIAQVKVTRTFGRMQREFSPTGKNFNQTCLPMAVRGCWIRLPSLWIPIIRGCKHLEPLQKTLLLSGAVGETILTSSAVRPDAFLAKPNQINDLAESV
jgi:hypothetical protein